MPYSILVHNKSSHEMVGIINRSGLLCNSLAAQYAHRTIRVSGYAITENALKAHFRILSSLGSKFDLVEALEIARGIK